MAIFCRKRIERAKIVRISLSGLIAQYFGARHPGRVDRLILIDTSSRYINGVQNMWNANAATARTSGLAPMKI